MRERSSPPRMTNLRAWWSCEYRKIQRLLTRRERQVPNWGELLEELQRTGSAHDVIRRKYLEKLHALTGRNVIVYYSGWLQKPGLQQGGITFGIDDGDKN